MIELVGGSADQVLRHVPHKLSHPVKTERGQGVVRSLQQEPGNTAVGKLMDCDHRNRYNYRQDVNGKKLGFTGGH